MQAEASSGALQQSDTSAKAIPVAPPKPAYISKTVRSGTTSAPVENAGQPPNPTSPRSSPVLTTPAPDTAPIATSTTTDPAEASRKEEIWGKWGRKSGSNSPTSTLRASSDSTPETPPASSPISPRPAAKTIAAPKRLQSSFSLTPTSSPKLDSPLSDVLLSSSGPSSPDLRMRAVTESLPRPGSSQNHEPTSPRERGWTRVSTSSPRGSFLAARRTSNSSAHEFLLGSARRGSMDLSAPQLSSSSPASTSLATQFATAPAKPPAGAAVFGVNPDVPPPPPDSSSSPQRQRVDYGGLKNNSPSKPAQSSFSTSRKDRPSPTEYFFGNLNRVDAERIVGINGKALWLMRFSSVQDCIALTKYDAQRRQAYHLLCKRENGKWTILDVDDKNAYDSIEEMISFSSQFEGVQPAGTFYPPSSKYAIRNDWFEPA